jgi:two-component sensor histidine kinase
VSAYRRLGVTDNVVDRLFEDFDLDPEDVLHSLGSRLPAEGEVERAGAVVMRRTVPLLRRGEVVGALVLLRDVTELRHREHMLVLKDRTIREIHHRVKNNLQTVASLLRLQARRVPGPEVRAALEESERRIRSIALVHETLSLERGGVVDFDQVAAEVIALVREGLVGPGIELELEGSAGPLIAEVATPLAMVMTELVQNSVDHAFGEEGGRIGIQLDRQDGRLLLEVRDDGRGLPEGFSLDDAGLGLQIVRALVESELGGRLAVDGGAGTSARVWVPVPESPRA